MIALIAHDSKKDDMVKFIRGNLDFFRTQKLMATGHTGTRLERELGLEVECVTHGPEGGDLVIGYESRDRRSGRSVAKKARQYRSPLRAHRDTML